MICKIKDTLRKFSMLEDTDEIIVGFSGGADSMCLLYILNLLKDEIGISVRAAHVNHCLRGEESERDERFVRDFCRKHSIELSVMKADIASGSRQHGKSIEEYGRQVRYDFFNSLSGEHSKIATAHNLNDCEETLIFNLTRGSALKGLCSIPPVRNNIIRPLIECSRDEIEQFCLEHSLTYVNDSTNFSDEYTRNKIRLNVIPVLKSINKSFDSAALRCLEALREDESFLNRNADVLFDKAKTDFGFDADLLGKSDPALKKRVISRIIFEKCGVVPEKKHIDMVSSVLGGGKAEIFHGETVVVRHGKLYFLSDLDIKEVSSAKVNFIDGKWSDSRVMLQISDEYTQKVYKELVLSTLDYDKIKGDLVLRKRAEGDKITLPLRKVTKTLKKLFNEMQIAPEKRDDILVLADEKSVVWVEGIGADLRVAPDDKSKKMLKITVLGE